MNPLLTDFLKSLLRYALIPVFAWMVERGIISPDQSETYLIAFSMFLITLGWSLYDKYWKRKAFVAALAMPAGASPAQAEAAATKPDAPPVNIKQDQPTRPMAIPKVN